jgi:membrane protein
VRFRPVRVPESVSAFARLRARHPWLDRLARAGKRYVDYHGYSYAASITYFSVLSLVPMVMVGLSGFGFLLTGHPALLADLRTAVNQAVPGNLVHLADSLVDGVVDRRLNLGVFGLVIALYTGWNWMNALRDALTSMWDQRRPAQPLVRMVLMDLLALLGLAAALVVSFGLTALGPLVLHAIGLGNAGWALGIGSVTLSLAADWLVFAWVLAKLPREPVRFTEALAVAGVAAVGFELLKWAGNLYLEALGRSPTGLVFGSLIGLLVFVYLVSRLLMLAAAWMATSNAEPRSPVTVVRPVGPVRKVKPFTPGS